MVQTGRIPDTIHLTGGQWAYIEDTREDRSLTNSRQNQATFAETAIQPIKQIIFHLLTERQRDVIIQYYFADKTQQQIAESGKRPMKCDFRSKFPLKRHM